MPNLIRAALGGWRRDEASEAGSSLTKTSEIALDLDGAGQLWSHPAHRRQMSPAWLNRPWRLIRTACVMVFAAQFVAVAVLSTFLFHRMNLTEDFGIYSQAWFAIGHGHLDPFNTLYGYPFYKNDFEIIMWPLAILYPIARTSLVLLWIQDLSAILCGAVVLFWSLEYLQKRNTRPIFGALVAAAVVVLLLFNPVLYGTLTFDFHFEPMVTLFALLAARAFWRCRFARAWPWVGLMLLCGDVGGVYAIGLAISALLAGRRTWRQGILLIIVGGAWLSTISAIGANIGSGLNTGYGYLAGSTAVAGAGAFVPIVTGILGHPSRLLSHLHGRGTFVYQWLRAGGFLGVISAWGFGIPLVVIATSALNASPVFIGIEFQNFAVVPFVMIGAVIFLVWFASRVKHGWTLATALGIAVTIIAAAGGVEKSISEAIPPGTPPFITAQIGAQARRVLGETAPGAEIIATSDVVGRFGGHKYVYLLSTGGAIPVRARTIVVIIVPNQLTAFASPDAAEKAIKFFKGQPGMRILADRNGVFGAEWRTAPTLHTIVPTG